MEKWTTETVKKKLYEIYGDKYDYSKVEYLTIDTPLTLICHKKDILGNEHGEFHPSLNNILHKKTQCPKCAKRIKKTTEIFKQELKELFGDKYILDLVNYKTAHEKVTLICPKHGVFSKTPHSLLKGSGCNKCIEEEKGLNRRFSKEEAFGKIRAKFQDAYKLLDFYYDKKGIRRIVFECPKHGIRNQEFSAFFKNGCGECNAHKHMSTEEFIERARAIHGDKYDYSKVEYIGYDIGVCIICPVHGEFWQTPDSHLQGKGCRFCTKKWKLEEEIKKLLEKNNISFIHETTKGDLPWMSPMHLDFYLPNEKIAIECQGAQHFIKHGWGKETNKEKQLEIIQKRDKEKKKRCEENHVKLLYYSNLGIIYPYKVYENKEELLKEIKNVQH